MRDTLARFLFASTCAFLLGLPCSASGPPISVPGLYDYQEVTLEDGSAGARLVVRFFHPGDVSIESAEVVLEDSLARGERLGSFADVNLQPWATVDLDDRFALPDGEIAHLRKGGRPRLYLVYENEEGPVRLRIDLRRESLIEEVGR